MGIIKSQQVKSGNSMHYCLKIPVYIFFLIFHFFFIEFSIGQNPLKNSSIKKQNASFLPPKVVIAGKPKVKNINYNPVSVTLASRKGKHGEILIDGIYGGNSNFTNYNTEQGLPLSSISCSLTDRIGNLWFGTYGGGVCRYDGKSFTTFNNSNGLQSNNVICIIEDKSGNLWFGTNSGGVSCYNGKFIKTYTTENGLVNNNVYSIFQDKKGNIWFGTDGNGVCCFNGKTFTNYSAAEGLSGKTVHCITDDKNGYLWFGTTNAKVNCYNGKSFIEYSLNPTRKDYSVYCICKDRKGILWFGTRGDGIYSYDGKVFTNYTTTDGLANNFINCIYEDEEGILWIGTDGGGVSSFDGKSFTTYTILQGLSDDEITSITEDNTGNLWFGTNGGGICRFDGNSFISYTTQHGLTNNCIWNILEDKSGTLWFSAYGKGLNRFNNKSFTSYSHAQHFVNDDIYSLMEDNDGNLWLGTYGGGVNRFDGKSLVTYSENQGLSNNSVYCMLQDKDRKLWFGTYGGGINCFDGKTFTIYGKEQGLSNNYVNAICEDKKGNLWIGTDGGGINCLKPERGNGDSYFTSYSKENGLADNSVYCIFEDKTGNLWFGTPEGASRFDGKKFDTYTTAQGLGDNTVTQILQDSSGRIFFGNNLGISVLLGWNGKNPVFENFNKRTGYPVKDINMGQHSMYLDSKGIIWAATGDDKTALVRFDYRAVHKNPNPLNLFIQNIRINEENVCWYSFLRPGLIIDSAEIAQQEMMILGKILSKTEREILNDKFSGIKFKSISPYYPIPQNLVLPYSHNHITFEFAAIEPSRPSMVNYQYYLKGYDETWSPLSNKTEAVYGNISEGTYTFYLKALSPDGIWSNTVYYKFRVLPPWYRTIWAYSLYFFIFIFILFIGIKTYTKRLIKEKIVLEGMVKLRTEEISAQNEEIQKQVKVLNQEVEIRKKTEMLLKESEVRLKELNATKDKLFSIIAHDLRSPFGGILGVMQILQNSVKDQPIAETEIMLEQLYTSTKNAYNLLNTLLDWAKSQTEQVKLNLESIKIRNIIENTISEFQSIAKNKGIEIRIKNIEEIYVYADENLLNTIIRNLISNSTKYSNNGGIITISTIKKAEFVEISIADNGIGISDEIKSTLFNSVVNQSTNGTANEKGTGLGLVICKEFTDKLGGRIWVESEKGKGSCFYFTVPLYLESIHGLS